MLDEKKMQQNETNPQKKNIYIYIYINMYFLINYSYSVVSSRKYDK